MSVSCLRAGSGLSSNLWKGSNDWKFSHVQWLIGFIIVNCDNPQYIGECWISINEPWFISCINHIWYTDIFMVKNKTINYSNHDVMISKRSFKRFLTQKWNIVKPCETMTWLWTSSLKKHGDHRINRTDHDNHEVFHDILNILEGFYSTTNHPRSNPYHRSAEAVRQVAVAKRRCNVAKRSKPARPAVHWIVGWSEYLLHVYVYIYINYVYIYNTIIYIYSTLLMYLIILVWSRTTMQSKFGQTNAKQTMDFQKPLPQNLQKRWNV